MRKEPTPAERHLHTLLKDLTRGLDLIPQWAFDGKYVLDFYLRDPQLGIEVDGGYHSRPKQQARDALKAKALEARGITLLRLTNADVLTGNQEALRTTIVHALQLATTRTKATREKSLDEEMRTRRRSTPRLSTVR